MNIYEDVISIINDAENLNISLGFLKNRCNMLQDIVEESEGTEYKVGVSHNGHVIISLYIVYLSTKNVNGLASVFGFANKIEARAIDDETMALLIEL